MVGINERVSRRYKKGIKSSFVSRQNEAQRDLSGLLSNILLTVQGLDSQERTNLLGKLRDVIKYESKEIKDGQKRSRANLHIIGRKIDINQSKELGKIIKSIKTDFRNPIKIVLAANQISDKGLETFMESLKNKKNLFELHFNSNRLNKRQLNFLIECLRDNVNIVNLELNNVNVTDQQRDDIRDALKKSSAIRDILDNIIPRRKIKINAIKAITNFLARNKNIDNISLFHLLVPFLVEDINLFESKETINRSLAKSTREFLNDLSPQDVKILNQHIIALASKYPVREPLTLQEIIENQLQCSRPMKFAKPNSRRFSNKDSKQPSSSRIIKLYFNNNKMFKELKKLPMMCHWNNWRWKSNDQYVKISLTSKKDADIKLEMKESNLKRFLDEIGIYTKDNNPFKQLNEEREQYEHATQEITVDSKAATIPLFKEKSLSLQKRIESQLQCSGSMKFDGSESKKKNKTVTLYFSDDNNFQMIRRKLDAQGSKIADVETLESKESNSTHKIIIKASDLKDFLDILGVNSRYVNPFKQLQKERRENKLGEEIEKKGNRKNKNNRKILPLPPSSSELGFQKAEPDLYENASDISTNSVLEEEEKDIKSKPKDLSEINLDLKEEFLDLNKSSTQKSSTSIISQESIPKAIVAHPKGSKAQDSKVLDHKKR